MNINTSLCVQSGVDVSLVVSTHIISWLYLSNLFFLTRKIIIICTWCYLCD